jgi:hypothetical protein
MSYTKERTRFVKSLKTPRSVEAHRHGDRAPWLQLVTRHSSHVTRHFAHSFGITPTFCAKAIEARVVLVGRKRILLGFGHAIGHRLARKGLSLTRVRNGQKDEARICHLQEGIRGEEYGKIFKFQVYLEDEKVNGAASEKYSGKFNGHIQVEGVEIGPGTTFDSVRDELKKRGYNIDLGYAEKSGAWGQIKIFPADASVGRVEVWCL